MKNRTLLDGSSMLTIAEQLNREKIEYRDGVTGWNKGVSHS